MPHDLTISGHLGVKRTYERIASKYYWKGLYKDVQEWISTCVDCASKKGTPNRNHELLTIPTTEPLEIVGFDLMGPFPTSKRGNRYILVFTDHFTKWVEIFAISRIDALTIAQIFVEQIVLRLGTPKMILSDRGKPLIGQVMKHGEDLLQIKQITTSAYHPQTNGLTERFNKTLVTILSMFVSNNQNDWDEYLPYVAFAYRTTVQSSTKFSPFYLMYGRQPLFPTDLVTSVNQNDP